MTDARGREVILRRGNAILAARMAPWVLLLPALKRLLPLPRLARLMWIDPRSSRPSQAQDVFALSGSLTRLLRIRSSSNCLERSLLAYRYLAAAGCDPELVIGVARPNDAEIQGHAWIELRGRPVREPDDVDRFIRVVGFGTRGQSQVEDPATELPAPSHIHDQGQ